MALALLAKPATVRSHRAAPPLVLAWCLVGSISVLDVKSGSACVTRVNHPTLCRRKTCLKCILDCITNVNCGYSEHKHEHSTRFTCHPPGLRQPNAMSNDEPRHERVNSPSSRQMNSAFGRLYLMSTAATWLAHDLFSARRVAVKQPEPRAPMRSARARAAVPDVSSAHAGRIIRRLCVFVPAASPALRTCRWMAAEQ